MTCSCIQAARSAITRKARPLLGDGGLHGVDLGAGLAPVNGGLDELVVDAALVLDGEVQQGVDHGVTQKVGLQAQVLQLGALGVVVVLLGLCRDGEGTAPSGSRRSGKRMEDDHEQRARLAPAALCKLHQGSVIIH